MAEAILRVNHLNKVYVQKNSKVQYPALKDVSLSVEQGEYVAIMGESGSGKTTLLNIIASLDVPTEGEVIIDSKSINEMNSREICRFRRESLGFVFQEFNLLNYFTLRENISFPLVLSNVKKKETDRRIKKITCNLGIQSLLDKYPYEVSGGEKQRAAIARALICDPKLVLADEPTGALDSKNSLQMLGIFRLFNDQGQTIIMVTHSIKAASTANRVLFLKDGMIENTISKNNNSDAEFENIIAEYLYKNKN